MESEWKLFLVLKALASSSKKALTIKTLMKKGSYKNHKELNKDLKKLRQMGLIEFQRSGFLSDSHSPIMVHSEAELPQNEVDEDDKIAIRLTNPSRESLLVETHTPFGSISYQTLGDFMKLPIEERKKIYAGSILDLKDGTRLKLEDLTYERTSDEEETS